MSIVSSGGLANGPDLPGLGDLVEVDAELLGEVVVQAVSLALLVGELVAVQGDVDVEAGGGEAVFEVAAVDADVVGLAEAAASLFGVGDGGVLLGVFAEDRDLDDAPAAGCEDAVELSERAGVVRRLCRGPGDANGSARQDVDLPNRRPR
jgi:hypothetical protein